MKRITSFPASQELSEYMDTICPVDAHIHVTMRGVWVDDSYDGSFTGKHMSHETTCLNVVRAFTCHDRTFWTLEQWTHDNGYYCKLVNLSKSAFLDCIHS